MHVSLEFETSADRCKTATRVHVQLHQSTPVRLPDSLYATSQRLRGQHRVSSRFIRYCADQPFLVAARDLQVRRSADSNHVLQLDVYVPFLRCRR